MRELPSGRTISIVTGIMGGGDPISPTMPV